MVERDISLNQVLNTEASALTPRLVGDWRRAFRNILFDAYSSSTSPEELAEIAAQNIGIVMPGTLYSGSLYAASLELLENSRSYISHNISLQHAIKTATLTEAQFLKGVTLNDLVRDGEQMLDGTLAPPIESGALYPMDGSQIKEGQLRFLREIDGTKLFSVNSMNRPDRDLGKGDLAYDLLTAAQVAPSGNVVERCIFNDSQLSGNGEYFNNKTITIGVAPEIYQEDSWNIAAQVNAISHEAEHARQPYMPGVIRELGAFQAGADALTAALATPTDSLPTMEAPFYKSEVMAELKTTRDHTLQKIISVLGFLSSTNPTTVIQADHNIGLLEKRNDRQITSVLVRRMSSTT